MVLEKLFIPMLKKETQFLSLHMHKNQLKVTGKFKGKA